MRMGTEALIGIFLAALLTVAAAMIALSDLSPAELFVVRICCILFGITIVGLLIHSAWQSQLAIIWKLTSAVIIGAIAMPILLGGLLWVDYRAFKVSTKLTAGHEPMPQLPRGCNPPEGSIVILLGGNVVWGNKFPITALSMDLDAIIRVDTDTSGQLVLSILRLFDSSGKIIARFEDDNFWVSTDIRRKRPDKSTLLVYDYNDTEALSVKFENPHLIRITGIFNSPGKWIQENKLPASAIVSKDSVKILPSNGYVTGNCIGNRSYGFTVFPGGGIALG